tara:strand:+ start:724 stop:1407 length:684 start_codon:yes stop_codon:yes gene_type:complete
MSDLILSAKGITKSYPVGHDRLEILKGLSLEIYAGDRICIQGRSGAGKSTLLHILGTLDTPSSGTLTFDSKDLFAMNDEDLSAFRNSSMGFVFQAHHLLPEFTAIENVMLPALIAGINRKFANEKAKQLLADVGLEHRLSHYPSELSGGEKQRVSLARAIVRQPKILFADEPTGNLDVENSMRIQNLLFDLHEKYNMALVVVTHDLAYAQRFPKRYAMKDGMWAPLS